MTVKGFSLLNEELIIEDRTQVIHKSAKVISIYPELNHEEVFPEEVFMKFYQSYYNQAKQYAFRLYESVEDAEDTAQSLFMKLWEKREKIHLIESPQNYLSVMVKNHFLSDKRIGNKKKKLFWDLQMNTVAYAHITEQDVLVRETRRLIDTGMRKLPLRMKLALELKMEGHKVKDIALHMGIKKTSVTGHLQQALKKIEACL